MAEELLRVEHLCKSFPVKGRRGPGIQAVRDVSFSIRRGETLGLVGESGCGKTTLGRTILRLHEPTSGRILYRGTTLFARDLGPDGRPGRTEAVDMLPYRRQMQIIFQDPSSSLDPRMTAGEIIGEAIDIHHLAQNRAQRTQRIRELLELVGLRGEDAGRYPHAFSGGQQQRVGIARALAVEPEFLVCDEPISALDVSIQAQVVNLLRSLQQKQGLTYLFIAHDLSMVRYVSDQVGVMYIGRLVEKCAADEIYAHPLHPYTQGLMGAVPVADPRLSRQKTASSIEGDLPSPIDPPQGCRFCTRCPRATQRCREEEPPFQEAAPGHYVACFHI